MAELLNSGEFPLWVPYILGGYPLIGSDPSFFLPSSLVLSLFVRNGHLSSYAVELFLLFQLWLSGVIIYFFLKELGASRFSSLFGSVLFAFSLPTVVRTQHTGELTGLIWIPIIFYSLLKTIKEQNLFWASISGLLIGICFLSSHIQLYFYLLLVIGAFLLYKIFISKDRRKLFFLSTVIFVIGLFIAAPRILPEFQYVRLSSRIQESSAGYAPFKTLLALFIPHIFGKGLSFQDYWGGYRSFWMFVEYSSYIGVISLILLGLSYRVFKKKSIRFFFYLLGFALVFMYGKYNPIQKLINLFLPGLRFHVRFMPFFVFAATIISSFTLDSLSINSNREKIRKIAFYGLICSFVVIITVLIWHYFSNYSRTGLSFYKHKTIFQNVLLFGVFLSASFLLIYLRNEEKISSAWFKGIASLILFADLLVMGGYFSGKKMSPDFYYESNRLIRFLKNKAENEKIRIESDEYGYSDSRSLMYRLEMLNGHTPNRLKRLEHFQKSFKDRKEKYLNLYNVKYEIMDTVKSGSIFLSLQRRDSCLPRVWIVHQVKRLPDSLIIPYMKSNRFMPREEVVIPEETIIHEFTEEVKDGKDVITINVYQEGRIEMEVNLASNGYLVFSEHYYPGWKAYLDGKRTPIIRANYVFRAVQVSEGKHKVRFIFEPESFYFGVVLASLALIFTTVVLILYGINRKKEF